ncbi:putative Protein PIH1D3 [Hypsibius exemplaris]|uniref:Globin domain-containing protein n=1 Tax=Hypsibius exemplaris TaxID=2072580 RepID=A0A1W0WMU5_HYPEX|nr:putative Protein PIH1D3 [Hypsibius exemplaris]
MENNGGTASSSSTPPIIRVEPAPPSPDSLTVPTPSPSKSKSASQPRGGKASVSRRGFALKRIKSSTCADLTGDAVSPRSGFAKESRSLSPFPPPDSPVKALKDTDPALKSDDDPWTHRPGASPFNEDDLGELLRSRGLRRVTSRIEDDAKASADVDKIPERFLTDEVCLKIWDGSKGTVALIEKLHRHFNVVKEKLYRARCLGMDQGIEAVQKGDSPFLEQHLTRIQQTRQDEMNKAKALQEARKESIEIEYDSAVSALWDSMDVELTRRMRLSRHRLVEEMMKNECDFMHVQLRHVFAKYKEDAGRGALPTTQIVNGVLIDTSMENSLDESMSDLWKLMRASIKQKYWNDYLSPEAEMRLEEEEAAARQKVIRETLLQGSAGVEKRKGEAAVENGNAKRQKSEGLSASSSCGRLDGSTSKLTTVVEDAREVGSSPRKPAHGEERFAPEMADTNELDPDRFLYSRHYGANSTEYTNDFLTLAKLLSPPKSDDDGFNNSLSTDRTKGRGLEFNPGLIGPPKIHEDPLAELEQSLDQEDCSGFYAEPKYDVIYKQSVKAEDLFLGLSTKNPSTACCDCLLVRIWLPNTQIRDIALDVQPNILKCKTEKFKLSLPLPHPVDPQTSEGAKFSDVYLIVDMEKTEVTTIEIALTHVQINLVRESWRWLNFNRPLQETAVRFFLDFYFKQNPDCLPMFGMKTVDHYNKAFSIHALTVMHAIKYAVEYIGNPEQFQRLFRTVGQTHLRFGLTDLHVERFLEQWLAFLRANDAKVFDAATVEAWNLAGRIVVSQILNGMHTKSPPTTTENSTVTGTTSQQQEDAAAVVGHQVVPTMPEIDNNGV